MLREENYQEPEIIHYSQGKRISLSFLKLTIAAKMNNLLST